MLLDANTFIVVGEEKGRPNRTRGQWTLLGGGVEWKLKLAFNAFPVDCVFSSRLLRKRGSAGLGWSSEMGYDMC